MRTASVALIEFHWLKPTPEHESGAAPRKRPLPTHGYHMPGRCWGSPFDGIACFAHSAPIVFFQPIHEMPAPTPRQPARWHRIH